MSFTLTSLPTLCGAEDVWKFSRFYETDKQLTPQNLGEKLKRIFLFWCFLFLMWLKILLKNNFLGSSFHESSITFLFPSQSHVVLSKRLKQPDEQLHAFNNSVASWMVPQGMNQTTMYTVNENGKLRKRMEKWACFVIEDSLKMLSVSQFK